MEQKQKNKKNSTSSNGSKHFFTDKDSEVLNLREELQSRSTWLAKLAEECGKHLAKPYSLMALVVFHVGWVLLNEQWINIVPPWDPYPYTLLATIASVEAPILTLLILMAQHREARISEIRDEMALQVILYTERELTLVTKVLEDVRKAVGARPPEDRQLFEKAQKPLDPEHLMDRTRKILDNTEGEETQKT